MNEKNKEKIKIWLPLFLFVLMNLFAALHHELWADEYQVWNIAKSCNFSQLYATCKGEGHPMLFALLLKPFIFFGFEPNVMPFISVFFATLTAYVLLKAVSINYIIKLLLIFGSTLTGFNAVQGRPYTLVMFSFVLVLASYPKRKTKPLYYGLSLALMSQTHIWFGGFFAALWILWLWDLIKDFGIKGVIDVKSYATEKEKRNQIIAFLLFSFSILLLLVQLSGILSPDTYSNNIISPDNSPKVGQILSGMIYNSTYPIIYYIYYSFIPVIKAFSMLNVSQILIVISLFAGVLTVFLFICCFIDSKRKAFILTFSILFINSICIFSALYNMSRGFTTAFCIFVLFFYEEFEDKKSNRVSRALKNIFILLLTSVLLTTPFNMQAEKMAYTDGNSVIYAIAIDNISTEETLFFTEAEDVYHCIAEYQALREKQPYNLTENTFQSFLEYRATEYSVFPSLEEIESAIEKSGTAREKAVICIASTNGKEEFAKTLEYVEQMSEHFDIEKFEVNEKTYVDAVLGLQNRNVYLLRYKENI